MTRLEQQIFKKEQELEQLKSFAQEKQGLFLNDLPKIERILKSYGIKIASKDNCFVDRSLIDEKKYIFRMYLDILRTKKMSERQNKNLEQKLRDENIPMPMCAIRSESIHLCYHD